MDQNSKIYYAQWTGCSTIFDNKDMAYMFFDLGWYRMLPVVGKDDTLQILVPYKSSNDHGLPDSGDITTFNKLGDVLNETLNNEFDISFIGYLASNDVCGFYFCVGASDKLKNSVDQMMTHFPEHEYTLHLIENDCWEAYTSCFFPAYQLSENIQNGMAVARLEKGGDTLDTPRPVYHGFRFRKQLYREKFIAMVCENGFHVLQDIEEENLDNEEYPFNLEISRTDKVDRNSLSEYTSFLWDIAYQNYGLYEGWNTQEISR